MGAGGIVQMAATYRIPPFSGATRQVVMATAAALFLLLVGCAPAGVPASNSSPAGHVIGSGNVITRGMDFKDFTQVEASSALKVDLVRADSSNVVVTADDNIFDHLQFSRDGQTLKLAIKSGSYSNYTLKVKVELPELRGLKLHGASRATISGFEMHNDLSLDISEASQLRGPLEAQALKVTSSGASQTELTGSADALTLDASGASQIRLGGLSVGAAGVRLLGASTVDLNVNGKLDADLREASSLYYTGSPTLGAVSTVGASQLRQK